MAIQRYTGWSNAKQLRTERSTKREMDVFFQESEFQNPIEAGSTLAAMSSRISTRASKASMSTCWETICCSILFSLSKYRD
jgi:hypothetical protein